MTTETATRPAGRSTRDVDGLVGEGQGLDLALEELDVLNSRFGGVAARELLRHQFQIYNHQSTYTY
jgi:hypothetical protein